MQGCWGHEAHSRPTISKVVAEILILSIGSHLIGRAPATIAAVLLDNDQVETVKGLSEDDAQALIDVADEVGPTRFHV